MFILVARYLSLLYEGASVEWSLAHEAITKVWLLAFFVVKDLKVLYNSTRKVTSRKEIVLKIMFAPITLLCALATPAFAHLEDACLPLVSSNGFLTLGNIGMFVFAVVAALAAAVLYVLLELPVRLLKWVLLGVGVACVVYGQSAPLELPPGFWAFFGALGIGGFVFWSTLNFGHGENSLSFRDTSLVATFVWGYIALTYMSPVVGFMAVSALGFLIASTKTIDLLASPFGIGEFEYSGSVTFAGFAIFSLYLIGVRFGFNVAPFEFGAFYISGLVFSTSLLINTLSGLHKTWLSYFAHELMFLFVALVSVIYGSRIGATDLVQFGDTVLVVWMLMKVGQLLSKLFMRTPIFAIFVTLVIGVTGVYASTSLMDNSEFLQMYTFLQ